jgi:P-type Mg2+ transporter
MNHDPFWIKSADKIMLELQTAFQGLSSEEASSRLSRYGANRIKPHKTSGAATLLANQVKSPIMLILIFAARKPSQESHHAHSNLCRDSFGIPA